EDLGQNSWLTSDELETFLGWLDPPPRARLIDIACGSGGPALRIARLTGCEILGVDIEDKAIAVAREQARVHGLAERAWFDRVGGGAGTGDMARGARRWGAARAARAEDLRRIEGVVTFEGQQEFFRVAERVARERRLSRFVYVAMKPA